MSDSQRAQARPSNFLFLPLVLVMAFTGCVSSKAGSLAPDNARKTVQAEVQDEEEAVKKPSPKNILKTAFSQVGNPYRYGGASPETGFDCSGFVKWVYGQYDIKLPRSSGDMIAAGKVVDRKELKPGDLVFFGRKKRITHVGIYTGDDKYIHSPRTGKSIEESPLASRARGEYYAGARRILPNVNVEAIDDELKRMWIAREKEAGESSAPAEAGQAILAASDDARPSLTEAGPVVTDGAGASGDSVQLADASGEIPPSLETAALVTADKAPAEMEFVESVAPPAEKAAAKPAPAKKHRVVAGDTLYGLARKYDVSGEALAKANNLNKSKAMLKPGQVLVVPGKTETKMAKAAPAKVETKTAQAEAPVRSETKTAKADVPAKAEVSPADGSVQMEIKAAQASTAEKAAVVPQAAGKIAATDANKPATTDKKHKVVAGDTLYSLARQYGHSTETLAKANNFADKDKAVLKLGQMLVIPAKTGNLKVAQSASADVGTSDSAPQSTAAAKPKAATSAAGKKARQHKVASGDTLYDLARKYGISTDALAKANNLNTKKNVLKLGQVLVVPPKTKAN